MSYRHWALTGLLWIFGGLTLSAQLPWLKVAANGRYFETADGKPFFWLGDTGWLLFVKCNRNEAIQYLDTRRQQGFNVIQAMILHDMNNTRNVYGSTALLLEDVSKPNITPGNNPENATAYDFWDHIDFIIEEAAKRDIYMALVPVWGSNVKAGKVNTAQAKAYGEFLGRRYGQYSNIIWLNGGDIKGTDSMEVWQALGNTIKQYAPKQLMTFHPRGRTSSSEWFHNQPWLDFNMFQSGHKNYTQDTVAAETHHFGEDNWRYLAMDYALQPAKPSFDGEPSYENIPQGLHDTKQPRWTDADLRRYAYWSTFAGGAGFTYGENSVMQFNNKGDWTANYGVTANWKDMLKAPGATQMVHLKNLMCSKPFTTGRPAQYLVANNGLQYNRVAAIQGHGYVMMYVYNGRNFEVDGNALPFKPSVAEWMNAATGEIIIWKGFKPKVKIKANPPGRTRNGNDWVLILMP